MPIREWEDAYSLGIEQIDKHHQHLLVLLNATYDMLFGHGYKVEIEKLIDELIDYATYHFAAEEQLMSRTNYVDMVEHVKQHEHFIQLITTYHQEFTDGRKTLSLELVVFLMDWFLEHITKSDRAFADAIGPEHDEKK